MAWMIVNFMYGGIHIYLILLLFLVIKPRTGQLMEEDRLHEWVYQGRDLLILFKVTY